MGEGGEGIRWSGPHLGPFEASRHACRGGFDRCPCPSIHTCTHLVPQHDGVADEGEEQAAVDREEEEEPRAGGGACGCGGLRGACCGGRRGLREEGLGEVGFKGAQLGPLRRRVGRGKGRKR